MIEYNIEQGYPTVSEALTIVKNIVSKMRKGEIVVFIHGYGSTGKGGKICLQVRSWLNAQVRNEKIKTVIPGEEFEMFNFKAMELKNKDKDLIKYYGQCNHGVTIVEK